MIESALMGIGQRSPQARLAAYLSLTGRRAVEAYEIDGRCGKLRELIPAAALGKARASAVCDAARIVLS